MTGGWPVRLRYGRGAARIPLAVPSPRLEMVALHPSRAVLASVSPLYLVVLLPTVLFLMGMIELSPRERSASSQIVLIDYSTDDAIDYEKPELAVAQRANARPDPAASVAEAQPKPRLFPAMPGQMSEVLPVIQIDGLDVDVMRSAPSVVAVSRVRSVLQTHSRRRRPAVSEFAPVARDWLPAGLPAPARVESGALELPAVSLPGPALSASLEGVEAHRAMPFETGLGTPHPPSVPRLPSQNASSMPDVAFPGAGDSRASDSVASERMIDGVALEALAACRSLAREDALKQELMLAATNGSICTALGGTYNFLETKNLNAFLMRVAPDSDRELGNRCDELTRAQKCLVAQRVGRAQP